MTCLCALDCAPCAQGSFSAGNAAGCSPCMAGTRECSSMWLTCVYVCSGTCSGAGESACHNCTVHSRCFYSSPSLSTSHSHIQQTLTHRSCADRHGDQRGWSRPVQAVSAGDLRCGDGPGKLRTVPCWSVFVRFAVCSFFACSRVLLYSIVFVLFAVAGKFQARSGLDRCDVCPEGQYSSSGGQSACSVCDAGKYTNSAGAYLFCIVCFISRVCLLFFCQPLSFCLTVCLSLCVCRSERQCAL